MNVLRSPTRLDDLLNDAFANMHIGTLQRAAEISPFITERTLGADLPAWSDREHAAAKQTENHKLQTIAPTAVTKKNASPTQKQTECMHVERHKCSGLQCINYEVLQDRLQCREELLQRNKIIHDHVVDMQSSYEQSLSVVKAESLKSNEGCGIGLNKQTIAQIREEAELEYERTLQKLRSDAEKLQQQTQRQQLLYLCRVVQICQHKFRQKYEKIIQMLTCVDRQQLSACAAYNEKLKELMGLFDELLLKLKTCECGAAELRKAQSLYSSMAELELTIKQDIDVWQQQQQQQLQKEAEAEAHKEAEQRKQQQQQQQELQQQQQLQQEREQAALAAAAVATAAAAAQAQVAPALTSQAAILPAATTIAAPSTAAADTVAKNANFASNERFQFYNRINQLYEQKVEKVRPLTSDDSMKTYRFHCQKSINLPVNSISAVTAEHLKDKFDKLHNFLSGQSTKVSDTQYITINDHPLARDYCLLLIAKKFVSQADTTVSSSPLAAFPFASVIVSLWKLIPTFGELYLAYTFKECPFLVPYFMPHNRNQPIEEYMKLLGYRFQNGALEKQDMYLKRQAGIARLYAAVMITNGRQADGPAHPYNLCHGWRWLSSIMRLQPLPDICATLITEVLQIIGAGMYATYGKQFVKLLICLQQEYLPKMQDDEGGPRERLVALTARFLAGQITMPQGQLPRGFW